MSNNIIAYDFEVDDDGDLIFRKGDLSVSPSNDEHAKAIIKSNVGEWKQTPSLGVGIDSYLNSAIIPSSLNQIIEKQFNDDGFNVDDLKIENTFRNIKVSINAKRYK